MMCRKRSRFNQAAYLVLLVLTSSVSFPLQGEGLEIFIEQIDPETGQVTLNSDHGRPDVPFTIHWGDCSQDTGSFPLSHTYVDLTRNYEIKAIAHYPDRPGEYAWTVVQFAYLDDKPDLAIALPMGSHVVRNTDNCEETQLEPIADASLGGITRQEVARVLNLAAEIQWEFVNGDVFLLDGSFRQLVLKDTNYPDFSSLWYSNPLVVAGNPPSGTFPWVPIFHEMGHNITLNSPANFRIGGKTDGKANAILTETLGYIFERATAKTLLTDTAYLSPEIIEQIVTSNDIALHQILNGWMDYKNCLCPVSASDVHRVCFASWNSDGTKKDETIPTVMTLAWEFIRRTELGPDNYKVTVSRMMRLLQTFDTEMLMSYSPWPKSNNDKAEEFRATLLVAALSYGVGENLTDYFRTLKFPVNDQIYNMLQARVNSAYWNSSGSIRRPQYCDQQQVVLKNTACLTQKLLRESRGIMY
jgi:hypothetical protein